MDETLPTIVAEYLRADGARDTDAVVATFTPDAEVLDEGQTYHGHDGVRAWRVGPAAAFDYTVTVLDAVARGDDCFVIDVRLDGDFPGGTARVAFRLTLRDGLIAKFEVVPPES